MIWDNPTLSELLVAGEKATTEYRRAQKRERDARHELREAEQDARWAKRILAETEEAIAQAIEARKTEEPNGNVASDSRV